MTQNVQFEHLQNIYLWIVVGRIMVTNLRFIIDGAGLGLLVDFN